MHRASIRYDFLRAHSSAVSRYVRAQIIAERGLGARVKGKQRKPSTEVNVIAVGDASPKVDLASDSRSKDVVRKSVRDELEDNVFHVTKLCRRVCQCNNGVPFGLLSLLNLDPTDFAHLRRGIASRGEGRYHRAPTIAQNIVDNRDPDPPAKSSTRIVEVIARALLNGMLSKP